MRVFLLSLVWGFEDGHVPTVTAALLGDYDALPKKELYSVGL